MTRTSPTLAEFKSFCKDVAPAARAVLMARVFAQMERERVDAYILPIFARYSFTVAAKWAERGIEAIRKPRDLYLSDDEPQVAAYFADCDEAHRAHGFTGPQGQCPALVAEHLVITAENLLIGLGESLFGVQVHMLGLDERAKYLDLLIGAALKEEK